MSAPRPFKCRVCAQEFTRSENLQRHKASRHSETASRRYKCPRCHAQFARRDVCKRHAQKCTGERSLHRTRHSGRSVVVDLATPDSPTEQNFPSPLQELVLDVGSPYTEPVGTAFGIPDATATQCAKSYFLHFHRSLPILHRPTFSLSSAPSVLNKIVVAIGNLYTVRGVLSPDDSSAFKVADDLWEKGVKELKSLVMADRKEIRKCSVIQAALLYIAYGVYREDGARFRQARRLFRSLVDYVRELELLHQTLAGTEGAGWEVDIHPDLYSDESERDTKWKAYISNESIKLALYTLVFFDSHMFKVCNIRPLISAFEFGWELPHSSTLWEATTSHFWISHLHETRYGASISSNKYAFISPATGSLTLATQSLMSTTPDPHLLAALAASPFAALCVTGNLDALVQEFTRCYYQLPPSQPDPSAFHILTQAQNKSISAALRAITLVRGIASAEGWRGSEDKGDIWHATALLGHAIQAALCTPDDLLLGGIVEHGVKASLATAAHLTLGSYFASRRSTLPSQPSSSTAAGPNNNGDGGGGAAVHLSLLTHLMPALDVVAGRSAEEAQAESPWATVATVKLLLALWKALRDAMEQQTREGATVRPLKSFDAAGLACRAISAGVEEHLREVSGVALAAAGGGMEGKEMQLLILAMELCKRRSAWPVGSGMAMVFEEILGELS